MTYKCLKCLETVSSTELSVNAHQQYSPKYVVLCNERQYFIHAIKFPVVSCYWQNKGRTLDLTFKACSPCAFSYIYVPLFLWHAIRLSFSHTGFLTDSPILGHSPILLHLLLCCQRYLIVQCRWWISNGTWRMHGKVKGKKNPLISISIKEERGEKSKWFSAGRK